MDHINITPGYKKKIRIDMNNFTPFMQFKGHSINLEIKPYYETKESRKPHNASY